MVNDGEGQGQPLSSPKPMTAPKRTLFGDIML